MREIYELAIESETPKEMEEADVRTLCLRYAQLERKLGEVDRARAIFVHASTLANPRHERLFWTEWKQFEVAHGNEDTFREMLRIQRWAGGEGRWRRGRGGETDTEVGEEDGGG